MMQAMMPIPPIHATATSSDVLFWGMIGLLVALFLLATIQRIVGSRRIAQRQSQVKEAVQQFSVAARSTVAAWSRPAHARSHSRSSSAPVRPGHALPWR
jgi:hypothetical protein